MGSASGLFQEPEFVRTQDLNALLKSEKLAKGDEYSLHLRTQLALAKRMFRKNQWAEQMKASCSELAVPPAKG